MRSPSDRLPVEVRVDPNATPGDLTGALAALILNRARKALQTRSAPPDKSARKPKQQKGN
jgi:hypothetical protein